jgi:CDP-diacylglycerol--serine O-phosphatidyltransferase
MDANQTDSPPRPRGRGIYLLPNLLTTAGLFGGFFAIIAASQGRFEIACVAIFVAGVLDGLDGRVARLTNTQSEFGVQYDSLADLVSFGMAPALVMYHWSLVAMKLDGTTAGKLGWLGAFLYAACAALRLARFNSQVGQVDKRWFIGLASPAAAGLMASFVWTCTDLGLSGEDLRYAKDPNWRDLIPFHEFFHGDTGKGLGASHQTGWTALVALLQAGPSGRHRPIEDVEQLAETTEPRTAAVP